MEANTWFLELFKELWVLRGVGRRVHAPYRSVKKACGGCEGFEKIVLSTWRG